jgi:hypothetical protein
MATTETILEATIKAGVEHFGGFPSGTIIAFAGKSVPDGWLLCNGALVSRTTYAKLFAAIGTAWGAGNGSTTFKLPDADARVMQGVTDASKVGRSLEAGLPNITGSISIGSWYEPSDACYKRENMLRTANVDDTTPEIGFDANKSSSIYGKSNTVQPSAIQILTIIKI